MLTTYLNNNIFLKISFYSIKLLQYFINNQFFSLSLWINLPIL